MCLLCAGYTIKVNADDREQFNKVFNKVCTVLGGLNMLKNKLNIRNSTEEQHIQKKQIPHKTAAWTGKN